MSPTCIFQTLAATLLTATFLTLAAPAPAAAQTPAAKPSGAQPKEAVLADFEKGGTNDFEGFERLTLVPEHATQGKTAGKITLDAKGLPMRMAMDRGHNLAGSWGKYDRFVMDVFVEGGPAKVYCFAKDDQAKTFDTRFNLDLNLPPGKRTVEIALGSMFRGRTTKPLDLDKLESLSIVFNNGDPAKPATIYLDNARLVKGSGDFEVKVLYSFEGADAGKYTLEDYPDEFKGKSKLEVVEEHATDGKKALKLEGNSPAANVQFTGFDGDWSHFDTLAIDVFNPADKPVAVSGWVKTEPNASWDDRHNWQRMLRPGLTTVKIPVGSLDFDRGRQVLDTSKIVAFNVAVDNQTVFIDNIRLVKGTEEVPVEGIRKFTFGPVTSAVMPGFTPVSSQTAFSKEKGFGWRAGGSFGRDFDISELLNRHRPPDDLCRHFCQPVKATFQVDLPNGEYGVWLMMAPPGANVWHPLMKHRTVTANGQVVLEEKYDTESFKKYEFHFQDAEDLPGDDLWEKYITFFYKPVRFDVTVKDGQLSMDFDGHGDQSSAMVCGLVAYPKSQEAQAAKWFAALDNIRKEQYNAQHVETLPPAPKPFDKITKDDQARGYVRFIHTPDRDVQVNSQPTADEAATKGIELSAAPGQFEDGCVSIFPLKDCGVMKAELTPFSGPVDEGLPADDVKLLLIRYKALNHDAVYTIEAKYLDDFPAVGLDLKKGITRGLRVVVHVPQNAAPGTYIGSVKLTFADGNTDSVPVKLNVLPIKLDAINFPMGIFCMSPQVNYIGLGDAADADKEWKLMIDDAKAHGMTSMDLGMSAPITRIENGKADIDFTQADQMMEFAKAAGFKQELMGYWMHTGMPLRPDGNAADGIPKPNVPGAGSFAAEIKAYFGALTAHAKQKQWLPISFCADDEFLIHPGGNPEKLGNFFKTLRENAPGVDFNAVDSINPDQNPDKIPAYAKMLKEVDTWGAGGHSPMVAQLVKENSKRLWLYNTGLNRFTFGTYMFFARKKYDVGGFFQWSYGGGGTYTNQYMASHRESFFGVVVPSTRGLRPTIIWERIRAGATDHQYLETAWNLIQKAKAAGKGAAEAAALEKAITDTFAKLTFGKPNIDTVAAAAGFDTAENPMAPAQMTAFRMAVAQGILKLQDAMK
jgi:hypothetical protein